MDALSASQSRRSSACGFASHEGAGDESVSHHAARKKITLPIIIVLIVMPPVYLCRRTPYMMISSLHVTKVMMLIMIMTTRPEIRDQRPETRDGRPETRDPILETRD